MNIGKFFIIINGLEVEVVCKDNLKEARAWAKEIFPIPENLIVREIEISHLLSAIGALFSNLKNRF